MENLWKNVDFTSNDIICDLDIPFLKNNQTRIDDYKFHFDLIPEPFQGRTDANIVLLALNPGYDDLDHHFHKVDQSYRKSVINCIKEIDQEFPFYLLNPEFKNSPGYSYWASDNKGILRNLLHYQDAHKLSNNLLSIEYFPYKSLKFKPLNQILPSQNFGFQLVRKAIKRKAIIIMLRSRELWYKAVPELINYPRVYYTKNARNVVLSSNNLEIGFMKMIDYLDRVKM